MVNAFFSAEKMLQSYNKYLTYANKLLFFSLNATFFAHKVYYCYLRLATNGGPNKTKNNFVRLASAKLQQKNKRRKGLTLYALISHKLTSERMNELTSERINE